MLKQYLEYVQHALEMTVNEQEGQLSRAARMLANTIENDGIIYVFGSGHSALMAEEGFYRAGGLGCVCPMLVSELMLHDAAVKSTTLEKMEELASEILIRYPISEKDTVIVCSSSGINGLPVEIARLTQAMQTKVICISSGAYKTSESLHTSGKQLKDYCDVWLNDFAPYGDACLSVGKKNAKMGPISTITGCYLLNALLLEASYLADADGFSPVVYTGCAIENGQENNVEIIERYRDRIRHL